MRLRFWGTRANIIERSAWHPFHSALEIETGQNSILIDCGADWRQGLPCSPSALLLTHAHDDHVDGLRAGTDLPVYATAVTQQVVAPWLSQKVRRLEIGVPLALAGLEIVPVKLQHSLRAPAVGLRINADGRTLFYAPDVAFLLRGCEDLADVDLYIGDGTSVFEPLTRWEGSHLLGHASIPTQIFWCALAGVKQAVFTHCGKELVDDEKDRLQNAIIEIGRQRGVQVDIAHHGQALWLE